MTAQGDAPTLVAAEAMPAKGTLLGLGPDAAGALDATQAAASVSALPSGPAQDATLAAPAVRTTVLPQVVVSDARPTLSHRPKVRYLDLEVLGEGGVGEVALVEDQDIGRKVALKRLRPSMAQQGPMMRFVEEVRVMGQLEHPNIVPVHDVGVDGDGRLYFVMKKIDGETLEQIIARLAAGDPLYHRRFPFEVRTEIFASVLQALDYAHNSGVLHRDLKPSNVMIGRFGEVVLMDWGIAKRMADPTSAALDEDARGQAEPDEPQGAPAASARQRLFQTRNGSLLGTPAYMSPEQASGANDQLDARSDLYSLSVMFHEFFTLGHYLSGMTSLPEVLSAVRERPVPKAWDTHMPHQTRVPIEMSNLLEKGLQKDPAQRFQSAAEMSEALHRILNGTFAVSCPLTLLRRMALGAMRHMNAHPLPWVLGFLFAALGVVGGLVFAMVSVVSGLVGAVRPMLG